MKFFLSLFFLVLASPAQASTAFTPSINGCVRGVPVYDFQSGTYEVLGELVHFTFGIGITSLGGALGSCTSIALPVIPSASRLPGQPQPGENAGNCLIAWYHNIVFSPGYTWLTALIGENDTDAYVYEHGANVTSLDLPVTSITPTAYIYGDCWYRAGG
jgi:hypothetical protein